MFGKFQFTLEAPIARIDAERRKLPKSICKLIAQCNEDLLPSDDLQWNALAELLFLWKRPDDLLGVQPINLFDQVGPTIGLLRKNGIDCSAISDYSLSAICNNIREVRSIFGLIHSEAMVFFFASSLASIQQIGVRVGKGPPDNQYERPYLSDFTDFSGFIFYSDTHRSFEVLGSSEMVINRCFCKLNAQR